jgi:dihydroflavonol-4-reductase
MRVLVTGATGFVGSHLTRALVRAGHEVRVFRRADSNLEGLLGLQVDHFIGDLLDVDATTRAASGCELAFHAAAIASYWRAQRAQVYRTNVEGTRCVLEGCRRAGVRRVVYTSSVAAIGIRPDGRPADEETPFDRLSATFVYAHSKHLAELEVLEAVKKSVDAVIVNLAAVIGPGDRNLISSSIVLQLATRSLPAVTPGGLCTVDVEAAVQGHLAAAAAGRRGERYIIGGENLTHLEIAGVIAEIAGKRPPRSVLPALLLPPAASVVDTYNRLSRRPPVVSGEQLRLAAIPFYFSSAKAQRELHLPMMPFRAAAEKAYDWYVENGFVRSSRRMTGMKDQRSSGRL